VAKRKRSIDSAYEHVVVGAGLAGTTAAEMLRHEGAQGKILLLSEEPDPLCGVMTPSSQPRTNRSSRSNSHPRPGNLLS